MKVRIETPITGAQSLLQNSFSPGEPIVCQTPKDQYVHRGLSTGPPLLQFRHCYFKPSYSFWRAKFHSAASMQARDSTLSLKWRTSPRSMRTLRAAHVQSRATPIISPLWANPQGMRSVHPLFRRGGRKTVRPSVHPPYAWRTDGRARRGHSVSVGGSDFQRHIGRH